MMKIMNEAVVPHRTLYTVLYCTSVCRLSLFLAWSLLPWLLPWLLGTPLQWLMGKLGRGEDSRSRLSCRPSRSWAWGEVSMQCHHLGTFGIWYSTLLLT